MNIAVILSGGTGNRIGAEVPKQYLKVRGRYMIEYCMDTIFACESVDAVVIAADDMWTDTVRGCVPEKYAGKFRGFSAPGENRQMSIYNALVYMDGFAKAEDKVMIHDAARPFISEKNISELVSGLDEADGVVPVLPMKDTVYQVRDGRIVSLLERSELMAGQAPEGFLYGAYLSANRKLLPDKILSINGSAEAAFIAGMNIKCIPGDERNVKITTREDLRRWEDEGV